MSTLKIEEKVLVKAPVERVWKMLIDPEQVVTCLPGAGLDGKQGDRTFLGHMKVKVGPVTTNFKGKAIMEEIDEARHRVRIVGEGKDQQGAGAAKMVMVGQVTPAEGGSELRVEAEVTLAGKLVSFGRGMIQAVSAQLFKQFAERARHRLEVEEAPTAPIHVGVGTSLPPPQAVKPIPKEESLNALGLVFRALWASIAGWFRRVFRRSA